MYKLLLVSISLMSTLVMAGTESEMAYQDVPVCENIWNLGNSPTELIKNAGAPLSEEVIDEIENTYAPGTLDKIIKLEYPNGYFLVYHVTHLNKNMLVRAAFSYLGFTEDLKIEIPNTIDLVIKQQGNPHESLSNGIRYQCGEMEGAWIDIIYEQNTVVGFDYVMHPE